MKRNILLYLCLVIIFSFSNSTFAKRPAPKPVEPVISNWVEYRAPDTYMGCVEAWDLQNNRMLWRKKIYYIKYDERLETDVQDIFIEKLEIKGNFLIITNERGHQYELNLKTRQIRPISSLYAPVYVDPLENIAQGNTEFAFQLYAKLADEKKNENLFFSPYSISTALAMTYGGARGNTEKQMATALHFTLPRQNLYSAFGTLQKQLIQEEKSRGYQLLLANALWLQKGEPFLKEFLDLNKYYYGAGLNQLDFANETEKSRQIINHWVEEKTNNKIKDLIPPHGFDEQPSLVLTNAIYFKGEWRTKFEKKDTEQADFAISAKDKVKVPLMHLKEDFKYYGDEKMQAIELPYKGNELSMLVLLPEETEGLKKVEDALTAESINVLLSKMKTEKVEVYFPKFKIVWGTFSLNKALIALGMRDVFDPRADFSGISGKGDIWISNVFHQALVEVNEEGTEAAAATAAVVNLKAELPVVFRADHPFIFIIKDNRSGSILFMGKVVNPLQSE